MIASSPGVTDAQLSGIQGRSNCTEQKKQNKTAEEVERVNEVASGRSKEGGTNKTELLTITGEVEEERFDGKVQKL